MLRDRPRRLAVMLRSTPRSTLLFFAGLIVGFMLIGVFLGPVVVGWYYEHSVLRVIVRELAVLCAGAALALWAARRRAPKRAG